MTVDKIDLRRRSEKAAFVCCGNMARRAAENVCCGRPEETGGDISIQATDMIGLINDLERAERNRDMWKEQCAQQSAKLEAMRKLIDTPHTDEWFQAVRLEAAHQIKRWGSDHDAGKEPADWFWLLGYLGGKALAAAVSGDAEKAKHHTISSGAALLNWFRAMAGDTQAMRPGMEADSKDD